MKRTATFFITAAIAAAIILGGCKKDEQETAPELPPIESLLMDFGDFEDPSYAKKSVTEYNNWGIAVSNVAVWNMFISLGTAIPVTAYAQLLKQQPVYLGDNSWEWSHDLTVSTMSFGISLVTERISNEEFTATMYVSYDGQGGFEEFKWLEGTVRYDHTKAVWTLYENPVNPSALVEMTWNRNREADTGDITYTNVKAGASENGNSISYSYDPERLYDSRYSISIASGNIEIEWDKETKAGRIKHPGKFGSDLWYCWDANLQNAVCDQD
jgi:hypothetical protein